MAVQVEADEVAGAQLVLRQADDRDRLRAVEDALDRQRILIAGQIERRVIATPPRSPRRGDAREALLEIPDQIVDRLDADREPDRARADPGRAQLVLARADDASCWPDG